MPSLAEDGIGDPYKKQGPGRGMNTGIDRGNMLQNKKGPFTPAEYLEKDVVTKFDKESKMKHLAVIQIEFVKEARKWEDLSIEFQKAYLKKHPKSKRRLTSKEKAETDNVKLKNLKENIDKKIQHYKQSETSHDWDITDKLKKIQKEVKNISTVKEAESYLNRKIAIFSDSSHSIYNTRLTAFLNDLVKKLDVQGPDSPKQKPDFEKLNAEYKKAVESDKAEIGQKAKIMIEQYEAKTGKKFDLYAVYGYKGVSLRGYRLVSILSSNLGFFDV